MPRPHPPEFRRRAIELAREGAKPMSQLAKDLGISETCLRNWVHRADIDDGRREGTTSSERAELVELRRKLRVAEMENEILRRAAAFFARENVPPKMTYTFIAERCDDLPVATCCRVMGVSASGFYDWRANPCGIGTAMMRSSPTRSSTSMRCHGAPMDRRGSTPSCVSAGPAAAANGSSA